VASITLRAFFIVWAVLLVSSVASGRTSAAGSEEQVRAPGLRCFPLPTGSTVICRIEVIPGISYIFRHPSTQSPSTLSDQEIKNRFDTELKEYQSIGDAYRELQYAKDKLESRQAISDSEDDRLGKFEDKYREIHSPSQSGDNKGISSQELHKKLNTSMKVYEQNFARLERIRQLASTMISRGIFDSEEARRLLIFAERWRLINPEGDEALLETKEVSAEQLLYENEDLRAALANAAGSSSRPSGDTRPLLHKGIQLGTILANPSDESLGIAVPGNVRLFTTFKPLTTYMVDDQSLYAIRLKVDSPLLNGFHSQRNQETPEVQVIAQDGKLCTATWIVDVQADQRFGQAQLLFDGELLRYADDQSYARGDEPKETDPVELPVRAVKFTPIPTKAQERFDRFLTWIEHFFGALGAPITFFLAIVSIYTNRAKTRSFWKWFSDKLGSASKQIRKRLLRKKSDTHVSPQS
jgi:hypothetical protein